MRQAGLEPFSRRFLDAWNTQDVERVVAVYTDDVVYLDPNARGEVHGSDALRRYLTKLFDAWEMTWTFRDGFVAAPNADLAAVSWHATLRRAGGAQQVEVDGLDLVEVDGDRIKRNEVYFDRSVLAPLLAAPEAAPASS